ncbi:MAG: sugar ABC transporter permease [Solirubrobacterales bacterium]|nr:sugar ABC transporter permease [Solirubrobacterales bacterium]MCB8971168.1 sugar ABC transporter permease [Thermoleophilales bacterium]MCO5325977.1 sugar ABC transporter permease [Solirubrobacterales bacterium]
MTTGSTSGTWGSARRLLGFDLTGSAREGANLGRLLVLPAIAFTAVLIIYPLIVGINTSLHENVPTINAPADFVGLENYTNALKQPSVGSSAVQTVWYVLLALAIEIPAGLAIAALLHRNFRGRGLVMAVLILPWALPSVVSGVLWRRVFDPDSGLLNSALVQLGVIGEPHVWLADKGWATLFIVCVHVWGMLPLVALVFIAGMQAIPDDVYAASAVDGATPWKQFRHITLPLLLPSLVVALVVGTVNAINIFDEIYVLNGTALNTRSILMEVYNQTFIAGQFAQGLALAILVGLVTGALAIGYAMLLRRRTV